MNEEGIRKAIRQRVKKENGCWEVKRGQLFTKLGLDGCNKEKLKNALNALTEGGRINVTEKEDTLVFTDTRKRTHLSLNWRGIITTTPLFWCYTKSMAEDKTDEQWRNILTPEQFAVLREKHTEAPFSGEYDGFYADGVYACAACGQVLFDSNTKFDAKCGWPSFYDAKPGAVEFHKDDSLGMARTEVTCANCGSHLGHIFEGEGFDVPTDKRYCINSLSLKFDPKK